MKRPHTLEIDKSIKRHESQEHLDISQKTSIKNLTKKSYNRDQIQKFTEISSITQDSCVHSNTSRKKLRIRHKKKRSTMILYKK